MGVPRNPGRPLRLRVSGQPARVAARGGTGWQRSHMYAASGTLVCMVMSVAEVAAQAGVSPRRVVEWIRTGSMRATKVSGVYVVSEAELVRPKYRVRPLSVTMAWALVDYISGVDPELPNPTQRTRLRAYAMRLRADDHPADLLSSWLRSRAHRYQFNAHPQSISALHHDQRVVLSGISDPRSDLSAAHEVEGYVKPDDLVPVINEHLLLPASPGNTVLHVTDHCLAAPPPVGLVIADLADYAMPRERGRVEDMLRECGVML